MSKALSKAQKLKYKLHRQHRDKLLKLRKECKTKAAEVIPELNFLPFEQGMLSIRYIGHRESKDITEGIIFTIKNLMNIDEDLAALVPPSRLLDLHKWLGEKIKIIVELRELLQMHSIKSSEEKEE